MLRLLLPHLRISSVVELSAARLRELGLDGLLLDVDCTLKRYLAAEVGPAEARWLAGIRAAGIPVCLVSNGRSRRIARLAASLGVPFVAHALKPLPFGCCRATVRLGTPRRRTAIVGDQIFADVLAGRLAGLVTILVTPMHPEEEPGTRAGGGRWRGY